MTRQHAEIRPSHPAEVITEGLLAIGLSKSAFARALGISRNTLYMLRDQRQAVTAAMAVRLEAVIGSTAETWPNLQANHALWQARRDVDDSRLNRVTVA